MKISVILSKLGWLLAGGLLLFNIAVALLYVAGVRINDTRSVAKGFYRVVNVPVARGVYVTFCPPDNAIFQMARERNYIGQGFCPGQYSGLMKWVAGVPGDRYQFTEDGLLLNGVLVGNTKPLPHDGGNRPMPILRERGVLGKDEFILIGDAVANSFDARYYGVVDGAHIRNVVQPVWVSKPE